MHGNATTTAHVNVDGGGGSANLSTASVSNLSTAPASNLSEEDIRDILERLNRERAMYMIPAMVWVGFLMFVGVVGNSLVVYVYRRRFKKTSSNYFILTMAIFDLIACLVGMPTEIYDLNNPYTFYSDIGCKIFRGCAVFPVYGSAVVLTEIAFDRYFKICRPLMVVSLFKIKMLCAFAVFLAVCCSIAPLILYGTSRIPTGHPGINGYDCSITERQKNSMFQMVFYYLLLGLFVCVLFILIVLYTRIWWEIRCRRQLMIGDQLSNVKVDATNGGGGGGGAGAEERDRRRMKIKYLPSVSEDDSINNSVVNNAKSGSLTELQAFNRNVSTVERRSKLMHLVSYTSSLKVTRTTVVLFAVTVAFVLSYLPAIAIMVVRSTVKDYEDRQNNASRVVSKIFSNFFFTNNAINPIIYSFLNVNFRRQAKKTVQKLFCCLTRRRRSPFKLDSDRSTRKEFVINH